VLRAPIRGYDSAHRPDRSGDHRRAMSDLVYLLVNYPALIAIPVIVFATLAAWSRSRTAWVAAAVWLAYLAYESGISVRVFCSGQGCIRRSELYVVYPLLTFVSLVALVQVYVHVRDRRRRPPTLAR
jgi:hypothetical protein